MGANENPPRSTGEAPILNIVGDLVALGPLRRVLLPLSTRWINDPEHARALGEYRPFTTERETK